MHFAVAIIQRTGCPEKVTRVPDAKFLSVEKNAAILPPIFQNERAGRRCDPKTLLRYCDREGLLRHIPIPYALRRSVTEHAVLALFQTKETIAEYRNAILIPSDDIFGQCPRARMRYEMFM